MSTVRGCRIGEGRPKVILPIVERTEAAILEKAAAVFHIVAPIVWNGASTALKVPVTPGCRCPLPGKAAGRPEGQAAAGDLPHKGGGRRASALPTRSTLPFCALILDTDCADLLDIEFFTAGADLPALVEQAHSAGVAVVCSSHDFAKTPPRAELVRRMVAMQQAGADLPKLAVMPQSRTDVLELLAATAEMADLHPETPVITMSMGTLGAVSRLAGETFGSAMTFANPGQASAPGQVSLDIVNEVLDALHL